MYLNKEKIETAGQSRQTNKYRKHTKTKEKKKFRKKKQFRDMNVCVLCCGRLRPLRQADHSSRGVLSTPTMVMQKEVGMRKKEKKNKLRCLIEW